MITIFAFHNGNVSKVLLITDSGYLISKLRKCIAVLCFTRIRCNCNFF